MTAPPRLISVLDPLAPAIERVKVALFRPFDPGRWLTIGFCAWLAMLGQGGGGGGGGHYGGGRGGRHGGQDLSQGVRQAWQWIEDNLHWLLPLVVGVVLVGLVVWALLTWLSSRGQFMFLHCVATNQAEVRVPWGNYASQANSLFLFRLGLGLISFLIIMPAVIGVIAMVLVMVAQEAVTAPLLLGSIGAVLAAVSCGILVAVIKKLTLDFVVPIMALRSCGWRRGWGEFSGVLASYKWSFLLYLLFQIVLAIVVGLLVFAVVIMTCCVAGCLLAIPFVGTVLLLPILVFDRAYSLYYLEQFDDAYRLVAPVP